MDCNLFSSEFYYIPLSLLFLFSLSLPFCRELNQMIDTMRRRDGDRHKCSSHSTNEQMVEVGSNQRSDSSGIRKKEGRKGIESELKKNESPSWPRPIFDLFNLVPSVKNGRKLEWKMVGNITQQDGAIINTIQLSASTIHSPSSAGSKHRFRVVTGIAPPFVQESTRLENGTCLTGVPCLRVRILYFFYFIFLLYFFYFIFTFSSVFILSPFYFVLFFFQLLEETSFRFFLVSLIDSRFDFSFCRIFESTPISVRIF